MRGYLVGMKTPRWVRYTLGLGLLVGGMAGAAEKEPQIAVRLPQTTFNVKLTGKDVVAPHFQLTFSKNELRGRVGDSPALLTLQGDRVKGTVGGEHINLRASSKGDTIEGEGGFLGSPVEVRLSPAELHLYVNGCTYRLKNTEGLYVGRRSCDTSLKPPVEVRIPEELKQFSPVEQVTLLLFSLS